ncbi:immunity repressor [Gordonia phage OneDirection]|nr:immunity repressor [Gordonia phage OneDirection]
MGAFGTVSALSDLLNSGTVSARQAAEKATEKGIKLPYGTIAAYWSGRHGRPSATTLKRLAQVVPFTEKQLQEAAWNTTAPLGPYSPPEESALLDHRQRLAVDELIRSIVATRGEHHDVTTEPTTTGRQGEANPRQKNGAAKRRLRKVPDLTSPYQDEGVEPPMYPPAGVPVAADEGGAKGIETPPGEEDFSQDPEDHQD